MYSSTGCDGEEPRFSLILEAPLRSFTIPPEAGIQSSSELFDRPLKLSEASDAQGAVGNWLIPSHTVAAGATASNGMEANLIQHRILIPDGRCDPLSVR